MKYECYFLHSLEDQISQKSIFLICFLFRQKKFFTRSYALARGGFARIATLFETPLRLLYTYSQQNGFLSVSAVRAQ